MKRAAEPTNIVWENRRSNISKHLRKAIVLAIMFFIGFLFFAWAVFGIQAQLLFTYMRYPPGVDCEYMLKIYDKNLADMASYELYEFLLLKEKFPYEARLNEKISRKGALTCFCKHEVEYFMIW